MAGFGGTAVLRAINTVVPLNITCGPAFLDASFSKKVKKTAIYPCLENGLSITRGRKRRLEIAAGIDEDEGSNSEKDSEQTRRGGDKVDWDKAWTRFSNPTKKKTFLNFDMDKYVSRRPEHSNYPLSEEVDPLRKAERSALGAWTDPKFTYALVGVIGALFVYMVIIVGPPPSK